MTCKRPGPSTSTPDKCISGKMPKDVTLYCDDKKEKK